MGEPVGRQQVLGHVRVEAGAEDPEVAFDGERQRGRRQGDQGNRPAGAQRLPAALDPAPQVEEPRRRQRQRRRSPRRRRRPAAAPSPSRPRRAAPGRPRAPATTSAAARRARSPPGRSPARRRRRQGGCVGPDHKAASLDCATMASPRPPATCCAPRTSPTPATSEPLDVDDLAARRGALARPLQPRVPARLRRVAARLPADPPAGARGGAAAHHRPLGRRDLPRGRPAERRLLHDQLQAHLRPDADRLPRALPAGRRQRASSPAASSAPTAARNTARFEKTARRRAT